MKRKISMFRPTLCVRVLIGSIVVFSITSLQAAPIGFWTFEEYSGQSTVPANGFIQDTSGNARHMLSRAGRNVVPGATAGSTALEFSGTLRDLLEFRLGFNGFSNSAETASSSDIVLPRDESYTIEAIVTLAQDNLYVVEGGILGKGSYSPANDTDEWGLIAINNSQNHINTLEGFLGDGGNSASGFFVKPSETNISTGWRHVALVRNRQTDIVSLYIDGVVVSTALDQGPSGVLDLSNAPGNFVIGGNRSVANKPFRGSIDMVRISDEALSPAQFFMGLAASAAVVPEPSSMLLLSAGLAFLAARRGRRRSQERIKKRSFKNRGSSEACILAVLLLPFFSTAASAYQPAGFIDASTFGYNTTDATAALQAAIDTGSNVWVPNMGSDWNVSPIFLTQSNQTIHFDEGVVIAAKEGEFLGANDYLFSNVTRENVRLEGYGATFRMRQQDYLAPPYPAAEFRFGIASIGANGFEIVGLTIEDTGGDGIYLGSTGAAISKNILIQDVTINNAFRNGIAIIEAKDVLIDNVIIASTSGNSPEAGIDLEPNSPTQGIENVTIRDTIIVGNFGAGIVWSLHDLPGIPPVTGLVDNVTIVGNGTKGLWMLDGALPGWTIQDTLVVENFEEGFFVGGDCTPSETNCAATFDIEYSALWDNSGGALGGTASLGTGSITNQEPDFVSSFVSTDLNSPYFMYLKPSTSTAITQGASDGGYIGARPVLVSGDFNLDTLVDGVDLSQWEGDFGVNGLSDADGDGDSDGADFLIWQRQFGGGFPLLAGAVAQVPEPTSSALLIAMVAMTMFYLSLNRKREVLIRR